jgi:hypothetical protein
LQKFLKERIWICQGQLHGYFSCRQQVTTQAPK